MAVLAFLALFLSFTSYSSATYCLCKDGATDPSAYQKVIDYACGEGADCRAIDDNGPCFQPNTPKAHCDYAANSYFQNKGQASGSCDFAGAATPSNNPPSSVATGCTYPSSGSSTGVPTTSTPGGTTTGGAITGTPGSTTAGIYSPTGLGPTGGITDVSPNVAPSLRYYVSLLSLTLFSGLLVLWG